MSDNNSYNNNRQKVNFNKNKLKQIVTIKGEIEVVSGLHIGGCVDDDITVADNLNQVIRNPVTNRPYIPGSSLKGKMRSLFERKNSSGKICDCGKATCLICQLFGCGNVKNIKNGCGSTRLIFRDSYPNSKTIDAWAYSSDHEIKVETVINRNTNTANHPRHVERVIPKSIFDLAIVIKCLEGDPIKQYLNCMAEGLYYIENDALGGGSSRGGGKVKFWHNEIVIHELGTTGDFRLDTDNSEDNTDENDSEDTKKISLVEELLSKSKEF